MPDCSQFGPQRQAHYYQFVVGYHTLAGTSKPSIMVNGMLPGPVIEVNEGDVIVVDVINHLGNDSVVIHWHGLYQFQTSFNDGVRGVSQCLIEPSQSSSFRYTLLAEPAGTTWWHGHYNNQYLDGLFGPLIIHRYGGELYQSAYTSEWVWTVNDWYDYPAALLRRVAFLTANNPDGVEPEPDAIMVNGVFTGQLSFNSVDPTTRVRVRVINAAGFSMYNVSVDSIPLQIIAIDMVDIAPPLVVDWVIVNVAQRVDFVLDFSVFPTPNITSIQLHFDAVLSMYPVDILNYTQPSPPYPPNTKCRFNPNFVGTINFTTPTVSPTPPPSRSTRVCPSEDINYFDARPYDLVNISTPTHTINMTISFENYIGITLAYLNNITFPQNTIGTQYGKPELYAFVDQSLNGTAAIIARNASGGGPNIHSDSSLRFYIPDNAVVDVYIINTDGGDHPFHLHGHTFQVIATSDCPQAATVFASNPLRRDTVSIPAALADDTPGWAQIRFIANNPGIWMFHCHIDWHAEAGLSAMFMEGPLGVGINQPPSYQTRFCDQESQEGSDNSLTDTEVGLIAAVAALGVALLVTCLWFNCCRRKV